MSKNIKVKRTKSGNVKAKFKKGFFPEGMTLEKIATIFKKGMEAMGQASGI